MSQGRVVSACRRSGRGPSRGRASPLLHNSSYSFEFDLLRSLLEAHSQATRVDATRERLRIVTNSSQRTSTQCRGQTKSAELPEAPVPTSREREREREREASSLSTHLTITIFRSERLRAAGLPSVNCAAQVLPGAGLISYQFCSRFAPAFSQVNGAAP